MTMMLLMLTVARVVVVSWVLSVGVVSRITNDEVLFVGPNAAYLGLRQLKRTRSHGKDPLRIWSRMKDARELNSKKWKKWQRLNDVRRYKLSTSQHELFRASRASRLLAAYLLWSVPVIVFSGNSSQSIIFSLLSLEVVLVTEYLSYLCRHFHAVCS